MGSRHKRKLDDFDPNKSDSDDLDYDNASAPARPSGGRSSRKAKGGSSSNRKSNKRRRETYGDSDDDVERDSDDISEEEDSFAEGSEEEEVELNPRTGRGVRSAAKKAVKYEESDEDAAFDASDSDEPIPPLKLSRKKRSEAPPTPTAGRTPTRLIVKLKLPETANMVGAEKRQRPGSRSSRREPTPQAPGTRRSSRISHDDKEPLIALSDSAKHEVVTRAGTATPEPVGTRRPTRGGKGLKKPPSAIMEVSQEDSVLVHSSQGNAEIFSQLTEAAEDPYHGQELKHVSQTSPEGDVVASRERDDIRMEDVEEDEHVVQESQPDPADNDDDEEDPISRGGRVTRNRRKASTPPASQTAGNSRRTLRNKKSAAEPSSDFEPDAEGEVEAEEDLSDSDGLLKPTRAGGSSNEGSASGRRSGRLRSKANSQRSRSRRNQSEDEADEELDVDEIADEAAELDEDARRNRRGNRRAPARATEISYEPKLRDRGKKPDYRIFRPEILKNVEEEEEAAPSPQRGRRVGGGNVYRSLFSTAGPFGGAGGPPPVFGGPQGAGAAGGVDSDSSDDERGGQAGGVGGTVGMTPTSAFPKPFAPQAHNNDPVQDRGGGPPGLGKVKDRKALADADPLGVDPNVNFDGVGGLDNHINQLKEMVMLPLLYPELFLRFHVTPPRGVLFHGPPGTGKTLLARALASSVSSNGRKVTFYMRKGADALSKWVGEAEKQLRLLFEEARKNQPSIIFFDEIDGLAPVRSSKQEQIHASIVATLLALMDGMDGRGQVIVIGATNRPDSVDPALRRPGRFDREFYFPLPDQAGRRKILDIHTKGWEPPLKDAFKDQLAEITRGYGGADLRALCTEAALNAVQGTYPQIYSSERKLIVDPTKIKVLAKDFMISVNKIIPSSERSAASGAAPLKKDIEPLLRQPLKEITERLEEIIPRKKKITALEEALYDDRDDEFGFEKETLQRDFEAARIFRPRLLIQGPEGMGQQYLGAALLSKFEGLHVQNFDLPTLMKDSTRSPEAAVVQLFEEVKRHKPSVIYIPNVNIWYDTLSDATVRTFTGLLQSLPPTDPVLLLGIMNADMKDSEIDAGLLRLFGYSMKNRFELKRPIYDARKEFLKPIFDLIRKTPREFPEAGARKKRKLEILPLAPIEAPRGPTDAELRAQKKKDRLTLNQFRLHLLPVMEQIKKYKKFRFPVVDENAISYLFDEQDPMVLSTDLGAEQRQEQQLYRPYELDKDKYGHPGIRETATGKFYYNLEIVTIEKRIANGYYKRPQDFTADVRRIAKDWKTFGDDPERTTKSHELFMAVEVDMGHIEATSPALAAECEAVYQRELERERKQIEAAREAQRKGENVPQIIANVPPPIPSKTSSDSNSGPIVLGPEFLAGGGVPLYPMTPNRPAAGQLTHQNSNQWSTTNGSHPSHYTNGSTVPSRPREDTDLFEHSQLDGQQSQFSQNQPGHVSQGSALTHMLPGSQAENYINSASTTTSGQKTHHSGSRHSGLSNGTRSEYPDLSIMAPSGGSQLPDTQPPSVASQLSPPDQQMRPPNRDSRAATAPIAALLNDPSDPAPSHTEPAGEDNDVDMSPPQTIQVDNVVLENFHAELTEKSSGLSLEQLEQIHAAMMDVIWRMRGEWNRNKITKAVQDAFNETIHDIEVSQDILDPSQKDRLRDRAREKRG